MNTHTLCAIVAMGLLGPPIDCQAKDRDVALLRAIEAVEDPSGQPDIVGDGGLAVGVLQLHPEYVADANRLRPRGTPAFTLADRADPAASERMFWIVTDHYSAGGTREQISRRHNGGPKGERKAATAVYWEKVERAMR